uniref:Homologous recombination OB-fold protein OB-fold domain-containing protein n=1 Tax=Tanacetum cinerariifolium TaxID=118510 RepID=A0A6L2MV79_TANCI|nr:hypothetical protein [Tanacetum cinerariifolium]
MSNLALVPNEFLGTLHKEISAVNLIVGADLTIRLRRECPYYTSSCPLSLGDVVMAETAVTVPRLQIPRIFLETRNLQSRVSVRIHLRHIHESDLHLTPVLRSFNSTHVKPSLLTPNPVRIIPGPAGIVQLSSSTRVKPSPSTPNPVRIIPSLAGIVLQAKLLKEKDILLGWLGRAVMSTQEYMKKVVEDVGDDEDFNNIQFFLKNGKLEQVVTIVKSCSSNTIGDLIVTMKDLTGTIPGIIHHKVIGDRGYGKDITVAAAMILAIVLVFTPKPSKHYLNTTMRNVVKIFRKDTVSESGSGNG